MSSYKKKLKKSLTDLRLAYIGYDTMIKFTGGLLPNFSIIQRGNKNMQNTINKNLRSLGLTHSLTHSLTY